MRYKKAKVTTQKPISVTLGVKFLTHNGDELYYAFAQGDGVTDGEKRTLTFRNVTIHETDNEVGLLIIPVRLEMINNG